MKVARFALLATSALPFAFSLVVRSVSTLPALLRSGSVQERRAAGEIIARQAGVCEDINYFPCSDGATCCPDGHYCGVWGGRPGCCPVGRTCVANNNPCTYVGEVLCPGEDFCCPADYTCSRDSFGAPKCSVSGGGSTNTLGGSTNTIITIISTSTTSITPSPGPVTTAQTTTAIPTNTVASGGAAPTTAASSDGGNDISSPFASNGAMGSGVNGLLLVAAGAAANILMAAH